MPEAILKLLQHTMRLMTGKGLDFYVPAWARPTRDGFKGDAMLQAEVPPVDDPNWGVLRAVPGINLKVTDAVCKKPLFCFVLISFDVENLNLLIYYPCHVKLNLI